MTEKQLRLAIVETGEKIYSHGFVAANDGNISVRLDSKRILTTPTGVSKGFMKPQDIAVVDYSGNMLKGKIKPSSELKMHLLIYKSRPDVNAIVHAHPPVSTGFAAAGIALDKPIIAEAVVTLGKVPLAPYGTPGTSEVTEGLAPFVKDNDAILMSNHGAVTYGASLEQALFRMETLEHFAKICLVTKLLGKENAFSDCELEKLSALRAKLFGCKPPKNS